MRHVFVTDRMTRMRTYLVTVYMYYQIRVTDLRLGCIDKMCERSFPPPLFGYFS